MPEATGSPVELDRRHGKTTLRRPAPTEGESPLRRGKSSPRARGDHGTPRPAPTVVSKDLRSATILDCVTGPANPGSLRPAGAPRRSAPSTANETTPKRTRTGTGTPGAETKRTRTGTAGAETKRNTAAPGKGRPRPDVGGVVPFWAVSLVEPLLSLRRRSSPGAFPAAAVPARPAWAAIWLPGTIADIVLTLPAADAWRNLSARVVRTEGQDLLRHGGAEPPETTGATGPGGRAFGTWQDSEDLA